MAWLCDPLMVCIVKRREELRRNPCVQPGSGGQTGPAVSLGGTKSSFAFGPVFRPLRGLGWMSSRQVVVQLQAGGAWW